MDSAYTFFQFCPYPEDGLPIHCCSVSYSCDVSLRKLKLENCLCTGYFGSPFLPEREKERRIDLQKNFRSRANVLEAANAVFGRIMRAEETEIEYDEREKLFCGLPAREDDPPVELHVLYQPGEDGAEEDETEARGYQQEKGWTILLIDARTGRMIDPEDETAGRYVYAL